MNKNKYGKILECLQSTVNSEKRQKQLETFEVRNGKLYRRKKNGKILRVLKEDETDAILFMYSCCRNYNYGYGTLCCNRN